jgi:hypothetical protein
MVYGWATSCIFKPKDEKQQNPKTYPMQRRSFTGTFEMIGGSILHDLMLNFNHKCFFIETLLKKYI